MDNYKHNQGVISGKSIASDMVFLLEQSNIIPSTCNAAIQQILFFLSLSGGHLRLSPCWDNSTLILSSCRECVYPQICATNKFSEPLIISPIYQEHAGGFPGGAVVGSPRADAGDTGSCPGPGRSHMPQLTAGPVSHGR